MLQSVYCTMMDTLVSNFCVCSTFKSGLMDLHMPVTTVGDALSMPTAKANWRKSLKALFKNRDRVSSSSQASHSNISEQVRACRKTSCTGSQAWMPMLEQRSSASERLQNRDSLNLLSSGFTNLKTDRMRSKDLVNRLLLCFLTKRSLSMAILHSLRHYERRKRMRNKE